MRAVGGAAARQQFGQQHRDGFQVVHLGLGEIARRAVLHHQHAERAAGPADRDGQQRGERLLAGFRAVGEGGMVLRVRHVHHRAGGGAQADDALTHAQPRTADGFLVQAFGCREFQDVARARDVDRAHFADQFGGDKLDQRGERRRAMRTQVAQAG